MRATVDDVRRAEAHLVEVEPRLEPLVDHYGPCPIGDRRHRTHFESLARAIVFQQLAGRAAATIWGRVADAVDGRLSAEAVLATPDRALRGAGLSANKLAAIRDLAVRVADGSLPLQSLGRLDDDTVVDRLVAVRGIGRWTAEMFLIFQLGRIDVWPAGDLGVRKGYALLTRRSEPPSERDMPRHGQRYAPYRSVAAWYCWRATETLTP